MCLLILVCVGLNNTIHVRTYKWSSVEGVSLPVLFDNFLLVLLMKTDLDPLALCSTLHSTSIIPTIMVDTGFPWLHRVMERPEL